MRKEYKHIRIKYPTEWLSAKINLWRDPTR